MKLTFVAATTIVIIIIGLSIFYFVSNINEARCEELRNYVHDHILSHTLNAEYYDYRVNRLDGQFDLPGDLLAWENLLVNDRVRLEYEIAKLEEQC